MPKQTLYFTNPAELSLSNGQLKIRLSDVSEHLRPIEDIRILIVDHHSVHLTVPLLTKLSENNVSVVFCNESHIPVSMTMDLDANCRQTKFFRGQLEAALPMKKQIWKQIVEHKIRNQARLLDKLGMDGSRLKPYYSNVRSGDSSNREGAAAKVFWRQLFGKDFVRDRFAPPPNNLLNYGYALLRSFMARAVMDAGLLPSIGVFHRNYFNAFPLVDDVVEPYRPFVDERVFALFAEGVTEIDRRCKQELLEVFYSVLNYEMFSETAHSLAGIYSHTGNYMVYPILK
jgi:CRISPR-associated protein Cas1